MKLPVSLFFTLLIVSHSYGSDCPSVGPLTEKKHIAEFDLSYMYPKGFVPVEMNSANTFITVISRIFYENEAPKVVRVEFQVNKIHTIDQQGLERVIQKRKEDAKYTNIGTINVRGEKLPVYEWLSKSGDQKYFGVYYPVKDGKYAHVRLNSATTNKEDDFHKRCIESFNALAKAIIQSIQ